MLQAGAGLYRAERKPVLVMGFLTLASIPMVPLELLLLRRLVDGLQLWSPHAPVGPLLIMALVLAALMLVSSVGFVPMLLAMTRLAEISQLEGERLLLEKTARLPLLQLESASVRTWQARAARASMDRLFTAGCQAVQLGLQCALLAALLAAYRQWLPLALLGAAAGLHAIVSGRGAANLERLAREQVPGQRLLRYYAKLLTGRDAAKEVRMFGWGGLLASRWAQLYDRQTGETIAQTRSAARKQAMPELLLAVVGGLMAALLILFPGERPLSAGAFALLLLAVTQLLAWVPEWIGYLQTVRSQTISWGDFRGYLQQEEAEVAGETREKALRGSVGLEVSGLVYRYPGAAGPTLDGVTLSIPPGCRAALVGENGSGKSTLVKLLTGMYTPDAGEIKWNGEKLELAPASAVFQDFSKLHLTVRENLELGISGDVAAVTDERFTEALRRIGTRSWELDRQIGAPFGGFEPSGGEWQQLAVARVLLRESGFVFFDEPTAALDPLAEKAAFELFLQATEGKSALLVTHRLGAAKSADWIFVLKEGRLEEQGTHEMLLGANGTYSRMYRTQAEWYA